VASALAFSPAAWAAQNQPAKAKQNPASPAREKSSGGGEHEGIKVHGHWTIEVRNPDGKVVTHREFENALTSLGAASLASILAAGLTPGGWQILLAGSPQPCFESLNAAGPSNCAIDSIPGRLPPGATSAFATLQVSAAAGQLTLNGTAVAGEAGNVAHVYTNLYTCAASTPPMSCATSFAGIALNQFTAANSASTPSPFAAVTVAQGQTIAVTVVISFSS
jgi:hypothetical protein